MKVRALALGVYKSCRRRPGDVFDVDDWERDKGAWMERVDDAIPATLGEAPVKKVALRDKMKKVIRPDEDVI